jgi:Flp pilus assembly pilin Flp
MFHVRSESGRNPKSGTDRRRFDGRRIASSSLWRDRDGVSAVEFAFVLPIIVLLLGGIFQFGFALFMQGHMSEVAREVSRRVAVGELSQSEAVSYAQGSLINPGVVYDVVVTLPDPNDPADRDVQVSISAPLKDISPIDILGLFQSDDLSTSVTRRIEFKD